MKLMCYYPDNQRVNISGIGNHLIDNRRLATFCAVVNTDAGPNLGVWHSYAYVCESKNKIPSIIECR